MNQVSQPNPPLSRKPGGRWQRRLGRIGRD